MVFASISYKVRAPANLSSPVLQWQRLFEFRQSKGSSETARKRQRGSEYDRDCKCDKDDGGKNFSLVLLFFCLRSTCCWSNLILDKEKHYERTSRSAIWASEISPAPLRVAIKPLGTNTYAKAHTPDTEHSDMTTLALGEFEKVPEKTGTSSTLTWSQETGGRGQVEGAVPLSGIDWFALCSRDPIDSGPECCHQTMRFCLFSSVRSKAPLQCLP